MVNQKSEIRIYSAVFLIFACVLCLVSCVFGGAEQPAAESPSNSSSVLEAEVAQENLTSGELIVKCWEARGKKDWEATSNYTQQLIGLYSQDAEHQQASLRFLPKNRREIESVPELNDVGTAYFIQGEAYREQGKKEEAIAAFKVVVDKYYFAQAWDPRGWFWSVSRASRESILKLNPKESLRAPFSFEVPPPPPTPISNLTTAINLYEPGKEDFVNYKKYGNFTNVGTKDYKYVIDNQEGLAAAVGEAIYPNTTSVRWDPEFKKAQKEGRLEGLHWNFLQSPDLEAAFLKWSFAPEPQGVKQYYLGLILEKSGLIKHALKCYYSIVVHFPGAYGKTYWDTPWYVAPAAISRINFILRRNPQLGYRLVDADIRITNGFDNDVSNDVVITNPGRFIKVGLLDKLKPKTQPGAGIKGQRGKGKVRLVQYENGDWQLMVNDKPYVIRGITYAPTKVGQSPDEGTLGNWMEEDFNQNGKIDGPFDAFVDKNRNNLQDKDEPSVGDFRLMKEMGVNTLRLYHHPLKINKELLRQLYKDFGIRVIIGDFLGKYAIGSGAKWNPGTDYNNPEHKKNMMQSVTDMVMEFKDEPYVLFWLLGNENVYGYACNADKQPEAFFKFVNEVAEKIKSLDPEHPVAICSGDTLFLDKFAQFSPQVDIFGSNAYRGNSGFGFLWRQVKDLADRPAFITEFGCPAYAEGKSQELAEEMQAEYHGGSWEDIASNMAFAEDGSGNSIGGVVFEWLDEWWKAYEPSVHDTKGLFAGPFPDGFMHEEWLGVAGQGDGKNSPLLRQLRKSYYMYKNIWN